MVVFAPNPNRRDPLSDCPCELHSDVVCRRVRESPIGTEQVFRTESRYLKMYNKSMVVWYDGSGPIPNGFVIKALNQFKGVGSLEQLSKTQIQTSNRFMDDPWRR